MINTDELVVDYYYDDDDDDDDDDDKDEVINQFELLFQDPVVDDFVNKEKLIRKEKLNKIKTEGFRFKK